MAETKKATEAKNEVVMVLDRPFNKMTKDEKKSFVKGIDKKIADGKSGVSKATKAVLEDAERAVARLYANWDLYAPHFFFFPNAATMTAADIYAVMEQAASEMFYRSIEDKCEWHINYRKTVKKGVKAAWTFKKDKDGNEIKDKKVAEAVPAEYEPSTKAVAKLDETMLYTIMYQWVLFGGKAMKLSDIKDEELKAKAVANIQIVLNK